MKNPKVKYVVVADFSPFRSHWIRKGFRTKYMAEVFANLWISKHYWGSVNVYTMKVYRYWYSLQDETVRNMKLKYRKSMI